MRDPGFLDLLQKLAIAKRILVVSDGRADGDSIGASTATYQWLRRDYPEAHLRLFCQEAVPASLLCLDATAEATTDKILFEEAWDLIITHDAGDLIHCGIDQVLPRTPNGFTLVNIDHHKTNARYGHINIVQTDASSTTEVLFRCFTENDIRIDTGMASSLLAGLLTDTQSFGNAGATASSLKAGAELMKLGGRYDEVFKSVTYQSLESFHLYGKALSRLRKLPELDVAATYFLAEDYDQVADEEATGGLSNFLNTVCGDTEAVIVLKEDAVEGIIKGSCRSTKRDISKFCKAFGGGGHAKASGFAVPGRMVEEDGVVRIVAI